jgi:hypothetical protein
MPLSKNWNVKYLSIFLMVEYPDPSGKSSLFMLGYLGEPHDLATPHIFANLPLALAGKIFMDQLPHSVIKVKT